MDIHPDDLTGVFGVLAISSAFYRTDLSVLLLSKRVPRIASSWSNFLPIRNSEFKDEVVTVLYRDQWLSDRLL